VTEQIVILDFGSQYTQVIARRVRECNVYSVILRYDTPAAEIARLKPKGMILSGGPSSVYSKTAPLPDRAIFELGIPVLGICYGVQLLAQYLGGKVEPGQKREVRLVALAGAAIDGQDGEPPMRGQQWAQGRDIGRQWRRRRRDRSRERRGRCRHRRFGPDNHK